MTNSQTSAPFGTDKRSVSHESASLHVSGEAVYTDDIAEPAGTCHLALGLASVANATINSMDLRRVRDTPGVIGVLTAADIPGENNCGPIVHDDPVLAAGTTRYIGQPVFAVVAETARAAREAACLATIDYSPAEPLLDPLQASNDGETVAPSMHLERSTSASFYGTATHQTSGRWQVGAQEQFYLESQITLAIPQEDASVLLYCSTQHPTEMQHVVAHLLNLSFHQVQVVVRRMGGGFGGKESQSAIFCCIAALAASKLQRPVKLRPDRDDDMLITGKRHACHYDYRADFDQHGRIHDVALEMVLQAGNSADLSVPVATRAVCHVDNAYYLPSVSISAHCARTHIQSSTAFRGFGGPQGAIAIEYIIDNIARELQLDPLEVRQRNFYGGKDRNVTPYGQTITDNVIDELVDQLVATGDYRRRRTAIRESNRANPILKRGIALTPVKFGISFNLVHLNQAGALVHVYTDGSVLVNHGGTEMGQGLHTKVLQVVAATLGLSTDRVRVTATDTGKVPNTSATAASTGADLNGKAAEQAALKIRNRLAAFAAGLFDCTAHQVTFADNTVSCEQRSVSFAQLVEQAWQARIPLWSDGFYATPSLSWDHETMTGEPFYYFAYGAAISEVAIDTLTGEWKLLGVDILHDAGHSINPAIDIGQIEGGFVQGMGWLTLEEIVWSETGRLATHAPSTYKIPAINDCPTRFNTALFENTNVKDTVMRSKAVGEPPLLLGFSTFFAIRDAIASVADYRINPPLDAPATPERILQAIQSVRQSGND